MKFIKSNQIHSSAKSSCRSKPLQAELISSRKEINVVSERPICPLDQIYDFRTISMVLDSLIDFAHSASFCIIQCRDRDLIQPFDAVECSY
jgi:hypothetical protein